MLIVENQLDDERDKRLLRDKQRQVNYFFFDLDLAFPLRDLQELHVVRLQDLENQKVYIQLLRDQLKLARSQVDSCNFFTLQIYSLYKEDYSYFLILPFLF